MDDRTPVPPVVQKLSQNILDTAAAILASLVSCNPSLYTGYGLLKVPVDTLFESLLNSSIKRYHHVV